MNKKEASIKLTKKEQHKIDKLRAKLDRLLEFILEKHGEVVNEGSKRIGQTLNEFQLDGKQDETFMVRMTLLVQYNLELMDALDKDIKHARTDTMEQLRRINVKVNIHSLSDKDNYVA